MEVRFGIANANSVLLVCSGVLRKLFNMGRKHQYVEDIITPILIFQT